MKTNLLTNSMNRAGKALCALCVVVMSAAFTGCEYDDTDLNNRVGQLEQRVADLEKNMTSQIEALQQMLNGKLLIVSSTFDEAKGIYKIVLSNGDELTVAAAGEGSSLISVMKDGDNYYWTLNGEPLTDGEGNKLPVAVAPGIRVNTATNEWEVSPDGGKTWLGTGITAEEGTSLFAKVEEDAGSVYFTLGDGTRLQVAKSTDFRCTLLAGKQYFTAGQSRTVKLDMSDVKKSTITKPDGWKASIVNSELRITAPAAANSYAETSGKVAVVAVASNGQSSISEVGVQIGKAPHEIIIDANMNVTITIDPTLVSNWNYSGYYFGARKLSEFSPEAIIEYIQGDTRTRPIKTETKTTIATLIGSEPEPGVSYVVYAVDKAYANDDAQEPTLDSPEDMMYAVAQSISTKIEISDATYENARLSVDAMGVSQCWAGVIEATSYNPAQILLDIQDAWTAPAKVAAKYSGWLSAYASGTVIKPGTEYLVWVLPVVPGKELTAYSEENFFTQKVPITPIILDGEVSVEIGEVTSTMKEVSAVITPGAGVYKFYSTYKSEADVNASQDKDLIQKLIVSGTATTAPAACTIEKTGLNPDTKGYFISVAVTKDGHAGPLVKKQADSKPLSYSSETITGEITSISLKAATLKLTGNAQIASFRYANLTETTWKYGFQWGQGNEAKTESVLALIKEEESEGSGIMFVDAVGGNAEIQLSGLAPGTKYVFFAIGVDKAGMSTRMIQKIEYTPTIPSDKFVTEGSELWTSNYADRPQLSNIQATKNGNFYQISTDVTAGEKCATYWIYVGNSSVITGVGNLNKTIKILSQNNTKNFTGDQTAAGLTDYASLDNLIFVVWQDKEGNYYQYETLEIPEPVTE